MHEASDHQSRHGPPESEEEASTWRRGRPWLAASIFIAALVIAGILAAASSVASSSAEESVRSFERSSNQVAAAVQVEIERTQGLLDAAAAIMSVNPRMSNAEFDRIGAALQWRERYPEVKGFGFVVPVSSDELEDFVARMERDPIDPANRGVPYEVNPPGPRPMYCLAALGQWRPGFAQGQGLGEDFCAGIAGAPLRSIWESGESLYFPLSVGGDNGVAITIPVYRGGGVPPTAPGRRARFLGWLGTLVATEALLAGALQGHPELGATLRYEGGGPLPAEFTAGPEPEDAMTRSIEIDENWTLETAGKVQSAAVWEDAGAVGLLGAGVPSGLLLGGLVFVLGTGRTRARRLVAERTDQLRHQALHDSLTGLPNRDLIADRLDLLLARNRRHGTFGAALFLDIDDFKNVNDTLGHQAGDQLLQAVAARLTSTLRDADTVGRLGGDEFIVLIDGSEVASAPELVAERLLEVMRHPYEVEAAPGPLPITASIGIAVGERPTHVELLRDADVALYEAKSGGKDRYEVFDREMWHTASYRIGLEFDLRSALEEGQFSLLYQPVYELDGLRVIGAEALLRWEHPTKGTITPDDFIPILERTGQVSAVGRWVLEEACRQGAQWNERHGELYLAVNLSARQLETERIVDDIREALEESGLEARQLVIEVTETALMQNVEATSRRLAEVRDMGARIAIDDFGTGYSSMAYLRQFPVDCLKIDRTFTDAITASAESMPLVNTLIQLGRDLGLTTLAEGIERADQIEHLRAEHVDSGQGFLFSRPVDARGFEDLLASAIHDEH